MKFLPLFPLLASLALPAAVFAQTTNVSYDAVFGSSASPLSVGSPDFPVTVQLPDFDSNLGTLTGVTLTLTSTVGGSVSVINFSSTPQAFTNAFAEMTVDVNGPDGTAVSVSPSATVASGIAASGPYVVSNFTAVSGTGAASATASDLALYEAVGGGYLTLDIDSSAYGTYGGSGTPGAVGFSGDADAYGDLSVNYTYIAIPEPSTYAAVLGLMALAAAASRRRLVARA